MSIGTSYSRTSGKAVLPGTWQAVLARHPGQVISIGERLSWDEASQEQREEFTRLAQQPLTAPPDFLRFNLAKNPFAPGLYPGSVSSAQGFEANGFLPPDYSPDVAARQLGITVQQLDIELTKFSSQVSVIKLLPGLRLYRSVGLIAQSAIYGSVTNRLLGEYWEPQSPSSYSSIQAWRQKMAVLAEWNGDFGYIEITLDKEIVVLQGMVGMQMVDAVSDMALPGGGQQYYVPNLTQQLPELAQKIQSEPLKSLVKETRYTEGAT